MNDPIANTFSELEALPCSKPKVCLGTWPTPLQLIDHRTIGPVFVKRDDLANFGAEGKSGVKARKLEGFLALLRERQINSLAIPLGNITNLGTSLIVAARDLGITVKLLIVDDPPLSRSVREAIFADISDSIILLGGNYTSAIAHLALHKLRSYVSSNRAAVVLPSPAHPTAILGAARGYLEAMRQAQVEWGVLPRSVYLASASGTTAAGFVLAEAVMRAAGSPRVNICAVQVAPQSLRLLIPALTRWTARYANIRALPNLSLSIVKNAQDTVYGAFHADHVAVSNSVRERYGIAIDPIYGAKSWAALDRFEPKLKDGSQRPPLFWHCGYTPQWRSCGLDLDGTTR